ncbi:isopentenyl-diphosphate delta-isomerase [uncultured Jannaschia sp.]|uniref:isopentenyl-diphosphate delta-isomerase n=1 Tax=uncultured Jannaschia sp. TaxID=293347 RepID=UPI002631AB5A|nr:isopentenyl-diphosphate delta-isomerase [uncultured Jannaschia sp.]
MPSDDTMIPAWVDGTLRPMPKLETHERGLPHKAISVFVLRDDAMLLQQRAEGKYHTPNLWANTCCTHPHWEESSADCAERRLREELGIAGLPLVPRGTVEYRAEVGGGMVEHEVVDLFVGLAGPDLRIEPDPEEVQAHRWIALDALAAEIAAEPERFTPWLRIYMVEHRDRIRAGGGMPADPVTYGDG